MMVNREDLFQRVTKKMRSFEDIDLAYIHGSFLNRQDCEDIDLAVLPSSPSGWQELKRKIETTMERDIPLDLPWDVGCLTMMPLFLQYKVITQGRCVHNKTESRRVYFEANLLGKYLDFLPLYESYWIRRMESMSAALRNEGYMS